MDLARTLRRQLYESAVVPGALAGAIDNIRRAFHSRNIVVERMGADGSHQLLHFAGAPIESSLLESYAHFAALNPRAAIGDARPVGLATTDADIGDERVFDRDPFYNDFLGAMNLRYFVGGKLRQRGEQFDYLSLQRSAAAGPVLSEERDAFEALLPDIDAALTIAGHLAGVRAQVDDLIEAMASPAALFDPAGNAQRMNAAAERLLSRLPAEASATLAHAIWRTACEERSEIGRIECEDGCPVFYRTSPVTAGSAELVDLRTELQVLVFFGVHDGVSSGDASRLAHCLGVTLAEARIAGLLADGQSAGEIAATLSLSHNTVRAHLAALRDKLNVHSQVETAAVVQAAWRAIGRET